MHIIDLHCDALMKLADAKGKLSYADSAQLDTNKSRLQKGDVKVQSFAIFIEPDIKSDQKFQAALDQIYYLKNEVLAKNIEMKQIMNWRDFDQLKENEIGAMLTLEGVDAIGNDIQKLSILHELGVLSVGLTWNNANLAADGAGEPRGAGLTSFGKEIVQFNNQHRILTDVSHLCEKAFWDVIEIADFPIASHSNSKVLCNHVRNLTDQQARALFEKDGLIHVVFNPPFINESGKATIPDLIKHIDHFCSLGGVDKIGFGSDFDGISTKVTKLEDSSKYQNLVNELLKYYSEEQVKGFAYQNFLNHRPI
ncbi:MULTISPECIES: dipeptidase [Heyndrickxia]|uniref:dipeptidase n=1 Tax=Heyndrickxia TaxID=2837504 RepID=UPI000D3BE00F|nr:dipeptidase [Heyndrickxia sporothermodurans]PTY78447.1 diguanylate cyclase [Heyndrickxia sporothermodurans]